MRSQICTTGACRAPAVTLRPCWAVSSWKMLFESDWSPWFWTPLPFPPSSHPGQSQRLTSTLMAQRPMASHSLPYKVHVHLGRILFSSANTWGPDRRDGVRGSGRAPSWNTPRLGCALGTQARWDPASRLKVRVLEGGRELSGAPRGNQEGRPVRAGQALFRVI